MAAEGGYMSAGDVETFHADGWWWIRIEGQATGRQGPYTRDDAVTDGRDAARSLRVQHIIHGLDGRVHERYCYGDVPREISG
jgi:hypothetical protein